MSGCSGDERDEPCAPSVEDETTCRAKPTVAELTQPWPELDQAIRTLASQVRAARDAADGRSLIRAELQPIPPFPSEGFGLKAEAAKIDAARDDASPKAMVTGALVTHDNTSEGRARAAQAFDVLRQRDRNRFFQLEPRGRLLPTLHAATAVLILERHAGTRAAWENFALEANAFVESRVRQLREQQGELSPDATDAELDAAVDAIGGASVRDLALAWKELGPPDA